MERTLTRQAAAASDHRRRLLEGMAAAIADQGYAAARLSDIVRHARVSRRTFYEHFSDKEACFLALYLAACDHLLGVMSRAAEADRPWEERVEATIRTYLTELAANPALTRAALMEIQAAGPRAVELRLGVHERFAQLLCRLVEHGRATDVPELRPLSPRLAHAITGGVNELVLVEFTQGEVGDLEELAAEATAFVSSVLAALRT